MATVLAFTRPRISSVPEHLKRPKTAWDMEQMAFNAMSIVSHAASHLHGRQNGEHDLLLEVLEQVIEVWRWTVKARGAA